jgi:thiol reductant ABC exporter CydC subunit
MTRPPAYRLALAAVLSALTCLASVALMGTSAWLIARAAQHPDASTLTLAAVAVRSLALARSLLRYGERLVGHDVVLRLVADLRVQAFDAVRRSPEREQTESGVSVLVSDVDALQDLWLRALIPCASALLVAAASVTVVWQWLPTGGAILLLAQLAALLAVPLVAWSAARGDGQLAHWRGEQQAAAVDLLHGADELLVHGGTGAALRRSELAGEHVSRLERAAAVRSSVLAALVTAAQAGATVAIGVVGAGAVARHALEPVLLAVVVLVTLASFEPVAAAADGAGALRRSVGALGRVRALLARADDEAVAAEARSEAMAGAGGLLLLDGASFRYPDRERPAVSLPGVRLSLEPRRAVAVVGGCGAGKSTLLRLLAGDLAPATGAVMAGGVPLARATTEGRAAVVALAAQDAHVFDATVADNLRVARPDASDAELAAVLDRVGLGPWLAGAQDGLATPLGHRGVRLSGGQRRRLSVARALLSSAPVLLLDEPTEGLEPDAADALLRSVLEAAADRAVVVVTHRVVALDACDEVLVLDGGELAARGTADELRAQEGLFRDAWRLQSARSEGQLTATRTDVVGPGDLRPCRATTPLLTLEGDRGGAMKASPGDRIIIRSVHVGEPDRDAEVLEVRGADGSPPFLVRWSDTGHEGLLYPGPETVVHHHERADLPS